ncbi:formin-like protein 20 isoform X1 [Brachypodium distachyon]|uniref:Uncharacterized protein n=1 Tax=Brachypodium distachyon TaxID=15368 RepID=I1HI27_BRADI|nr:formin-like protein 20 isoform X1 [Brachypodium distachyon]KQK05603.1 hypothetical protein BRADI_2g21130v3 [Brachypodium distachyon]|eukprot:XP_010231216.1 formin-like protein 20 isoform X1 [Brachypodium distachyon]
MDTGEQAEESSASRRERLLALRSAAASASSSASSPSAAPPPPPGTAAWDLPEPDLMPSSAPRPPPRFDFYTNPGAAFSSAAAPHKRKSAHSPPRSPAPAPPQAGSGNYGNNYPPPHQQHMPRSPIHSPFPMAPGTPGNSQWQSHMQFQTPMSGYRGTHPGPPPQWNPHSASPAQVYHPHPPSYGFRGPNVGRGGTPMNFVPRGSPYPSPGQGRGGNYYSNPGSRGKGGRGFQNHSGWQDRRNYYSKSMVDDPWQDLQPIVGNIMIPVGAASQSWLPKSLRAKKDTSDQGPQGSGSRLSLAEYLDLSFNETSNET